MKRKPFSKQALGRIRRDTRRNAIAAKQAWLDHAATASHGVAS